LVSEDVDLGNPYDTKRVYANVQSIVQQNFIALHQLTIELNHTIMSLKGYRREFASKHPIFQTIKAAEIKGVDVAIADLERLRDENLTAGPGTTYNQQAIRIQDSLQKNILSKPEKK
jgi:hypothetical protein